MKTSELSGAQLADQVALALGWVLFDGDGGQGIWHTTEGPHQLRRRWKPQEDWAQGGPLIDTPDSPIMQLEHCSTEPCLAWNVTLDDEEGVYWGSTMLEAAMRAYVASKFGDTVPDEAT